MTKNLKFLSAVLLASLLLGSCFGKKKPNQPAVGTSAEPDKVLYERAVEDVRKGRYAVGRLTLQTLINTYPDSEYLAKAKLGIADAYFKEGGTAGLTQAAAEYKDFITFFPFLDEAAYAQMQVGMVHYRRMEKPDRDRSQGRSAEEEFQIFLQKYSNHALASQAEQRLREVQEIMAEGDYRIARFYYVKGSMRAAAARLLELTSRYPLYSQADKALWMLGGVFDRAEKNDLAAQYYSRIVREYPLSGLVEDAKAKLVKLGVPVPQPEPTALARMQHERDAERQRPGLMRRSMGIFRTGPDVSMAAQSGKPNLNPPSETASATEVLTPGGSKPMVGGATAGTPGSGNTAYVERVSPGPPGNNPPTGSATTETAPGAAPPAPSAENPPKPDASTPDAKPATDSSQTSDDKNKKKKESSSKKKKGLRKLVPW